VDLEIRQETAADGKKKTEVQRAVGKVLTSEPANIKSRSVIVRARCRSMGDKRRTPTGAFGPP